MKLLSAVISSALAAKEQNAERRLEKITARAAEVNAFVQSYPRSTQRQKDGVEKWVSRVLEDLNNIDTSKCPPPAEEDKFTEEIDTIDNLCEDSLKVASMIRSYARTFGCVEGFPKRKFLERVIARSHKLKNVARRAGRCDKPIATTEPAPTEEPTTLAPVTSVCGKNRHAKCRSLGNSEIFFENEWTCRNCFRIRAYYGTGGGFNFDPSKGDYVSIKFTEPVYFQKWNHPLTEPAEIAGSNKHHWKMNFKNDGNFVSGMMFDAELITSDLDLWVDGQWIIDSAQSCRCKPGPDPNVCLPADPCSGRENCEAFVDSCGTTPSRNNNIATTAGSPAFKVSAEVKCGEIPDDWQNIIHINAGSRWDVLGDRYFALFAGPETMKFSAPLKNSGNVPGGGNFMVNHYPSCTPGEWNKYQVEQRYTDAEDTLELTMSIDDEVFVTRIVDVADAYSGDLFVDVSNDFHDSATGFKVRNFYHQTFPEAKPCDSVDPCEGRDNCDTLVDSCSIRPQHSTQIGSVDGNAVYSASVDVFCRRSEGHSWQSVVHMTQGGYRENFGDRYFTIWQRDDGKLKINAPLKGNTQFDEVEYFVDCENNSWTNIAVKQTQIDFGRLELTVIQDGNALGSKIIHHTDAFVGPIEVWSGNSWFEPASFFKIKNFIHSSRPYEPESCEEPTDPCEGLEYCETFQDSCAVAPFRGNRLCESIGHLGFKISAEVQCTDRVAPSWENVLHVHTGTNRENFGDRYFTIWKEANKPDGIRIVAPAFENANHELNAYVSCSPGWHTFTVQQTESGKNHMLLEILMDGSVVASQEVRKTETYQGPLFVEASNAFVWPAAYDHLVRNFYHQAILSDDPCFGKENCTTFIDATSISPSENNQIATVTAAVNHKTSVEILCNHDMPIAGVHYQLLHMTKNDGSRTLGDRFFSFWRRHTSQEILINYASPIGNQWGETGRFWDCIPGEWNTYTLEQRQDIDKPFMTTSTVYIDEVNVHSVRAETSEILKDVPVKVFVSKGLPADAFKIKNFFYQTFAELLYEEPTAAPCSDGRENCFEFVASVPVVPELNLRKATITAHANNEISVDIKCGTMNDNVYNSIVEITNGAARGVLGERVFMIWEAPTGRPGKLLINVADPTGANNDTGFWVDCNDGDWNTYTLSQRQNASDPELTDVVFTIDGVTKHTRQVPTADVFRNDDIKVYAGRWHPATDYEIRNFSYQFFGDVPLGPQNCNNVQNCVIVGADSVSPVQGNLAATITAVKNYKFSIDIKCDHSLPFDGFKNIFHVTTGPNDDVYGSRQFAIWRSSNENKMHITWANPKAAAGHSRNYFNCNEGEWNTYTFEQWQQAPNQPQWIWHKLSIDGVKIDAKRFNDDDYPVLDGEQLNVWISNEAADAASTFEIRNFSYEKYPDV